VPLLPHRTPNGTRRVPTTFEENAMNPLLPAMLLLAPTAPPEAPKVDFNRDVRPILADHCFQCHGPDANKRKAGLRLDVDPAGEKRETAVIVPGKPAESELIRRVTADDLRDRMPPMKFGRQLSEKQIEILKIWTLQGGKWEKHWSLLAPTRPEPPKTKHATANPIDAFTFARLEKEGQTPSKEADRVTLIRRMTFDLTGLPPTPAEVDAFVNDKNPNAVEKLADRLLASPRYGERMAWRWLEAARYADTHGYQTDGEREMWRWRDWVIEAHNRNLPFDQFTIEQLAGDLLPKPTLDQRIATGFNRNHRGNSEGGIVPEEYAVEYVVDRVETTATVWLGLTLGCARCHDHKFDPFSQKEFYQLYAYFNNVPEKGRAVKNGNSPPYIKAPTREQTNKLAELDAKLEEAETAWAKFESKMAELIIAWEKDRPSVTNWVPDRGLVASRALGPNEQHEAHGGEPVYAQGRKGRVLAFDGKRFGDLGDLGDFGYDDRFSFAVWMNPKERTGAILSRMPEEPQAEGYAVELVDGKVRVSLTKRWLDDALRVETSAAVKVGAWQHVAVTYDGSRLACGVKIYVDGVEQKITTLLDELNQTFQNKESFRLGSAGGKANRFVGQMEEFRLYNRALEPREATVLAVIPSVADILAKEWLDRTLAELEKLRAYYLEVGAPAEVRKPFLALRDLRETRAKFWDSVPTVMVMEEMPNPRDAFVLLRGEYDKKGTKVERATPAQLPAMPKDAPSNRLGLAKWLVRAENPLTARVAVNRMWQLHFGKGLVRTAEDFGTQGEYPSHPELFDWLATEFAKDWDVKRMHKLIVTSATYRQSSRITKELLEHDPDNKLFARGPRLRLSAEMIRDQALFASGLLVEKQGGPSVKPYQPAGLWNELSGTGDYKPDTGEKLYRRSLYTFWKRTVPPPTLGAFDTSMRETCWVRETRTNTPLHALTLLNDVTFVEAARVLAQRVMLEEVTPEKRLARAFQFLTARTPTDTEAKVLLGAFARQHATYKKNPADARRLLQVGESKPDPKLDVAELAAYAQVCSLIMNLDESVTKE
jgi:mono/diheme cytochrome c family protein